MNKQISAPFNGWCLNPKGLLNGTLSHPFGTNSRVQVCFCLQFLPFKKELVVCGTSILQKSSQFLPGCSSSIIPMEGARPVFYDSLDAA